MPRPSVRTSRRVAAGLAAIALTSALTTTADAAPARDSGGSTCKRRCADTVAPTVAVQSPATGSTVSGTVTVAGSAGDNVSVASVAVQVDGGPWAPAGSTTSWSASLDTTSYANGDHTIVARATDAAGNSSTSSVVARVANPTADTTAPAVSISAPTAGSTVTGSVIVSGTSGDASGVSSVTVSVDGGAAQAASGSTSWSVPIDTSSLAAGPHAITARATDPAGNAGTATVTVNVAAPPSGEGDDVVITDPAATGTLSSLLRTRLIQRGDLTGVLYLDDGAYRPAVYFRDAVTRAASLVDLPSDSRQGWMYAAAAMPTDTDLWIAGGNGPMILRHYRLSGSPLPTAASLVETRTFGDSDSRPGDMIGLAGGGLVLAWHQQGATGPNGQFVAYRSPAGAWSQLPALTFMPTRASDQVLAQHPADASVWLFSSPDAWSAVGVAHLSEAGGALAVDWTNGTYLTQERYGSYGPHEENPDLAVAADPASNTLALAYQSADRRYYNDGTTIVGGSRVAVARIPASGAPSFLAVPEYSERVSDVGLVVVGGETLVTHHVVDEASLSYSALSMSRYRAGVWEPAVALGEADAASYAEGRGELAVRTADGRLHLLTR